MFAVAIVGDERIILVVVVAVVVVIYSGVKTPSR